MQIEHHRELLLIYQRYLAAIGVATAPIDCLLARQEGHGSDTRGPLWAHTHLLREKVILRSTGPPVPTVAPDIAREITHAAQ